MQMNYIAALLRSFGTSASTAEVPQDKSTVCWLLRAKNEHSNLRLVEEGDRTRDSPQREVSAGAADA